MPQQKPRFTFVLITAGILGLLSLAVLLLSLQNWQLISISLFSSSHDLSFGLFGLIAWSIGSLTTWFVCQVLDKKKENAETQQSWQTQDAKLIAEMVADKEKLLQAKIATLESALKTALKKQS